MPSNQEVKGWIESNLDCSLVEVNSPDEVHFDAVVVSNEFAGCSAVKRHQLVYKALGDKMVSVIHALSMATYTDEEWRDRDRS